ncbi:Dolichol kinase EVAN [Linum perenne]
MASVSNPLPLFTGERAVVVMFIGCLLYSLPHSLLYPAIFLSFISLFAIVVEIRSESSGSLSHFKTRPGASSGIFLGAVTLPALMLSKLIQLSRALALHEIELREVDYLLMQYWATSVSCFSVLIFLSFVTWGLVFSLITMLLMPVIILVFLTGMQTTSKLLWVLFHGIATVSLMQHVLKTFPSCASMGLVLYFGDVLACTIAKATFVQYGIKRDEISIVIQGLLLGLLLFPVAFKFLLHAIDSLPRISSSGTVMHNGRRRSLIFFASLGFVMIVVMPSWMQFVWDFQPAKRLSLCLYWVFLIYVSVRRFYFISKNSKTERILPKFLDLAFGAALAIFLTLEIIRVWRIWPLGQLVHQFMNAFTDHRDSDLLIVSHFSLLLGCALPIWLSFGYNDRPLAPFAGILSLGIGDTMASMVGHKYEKTIEGTAAGITSVLVACSVLLPVLASAGFIFTQQWLSLLVAVTLSGLLEAYTAQLDNAFIPLVFYSLLCL